MDFWEWANEYGSGLTAVATVGLVIAGIWTLLAAQSDSRKKSRPMMSAYFTIGKENPLAIYFNLQNFGLTRAKNVRVMFDPPLKHDDTTSNIVARYATPIGAFNPAEIYSNRWHTPEYESDGKLKGNAQNLPDRVEVTVVYDCWWWLKYSDVTVLDVATHIYTDTSTHSNYYLGNMRKTSKSLRSIAEELSAIRHKISGD